MESKQVQLESALNDSKVQAANELNDVKVALEQSQETVKVIWNYLPRVENENYCPLTAFECMTVRMRFNKRLLETFRDFLRLFQWTKFPFRNFWK